MSLYVIIVIDNVHKRSAKYSREENRKITIQEAIMILPNCLSRKLIQWKGHFVMLVLKFGIKISKIKNKTRSQIIVFLGDPTCKRFSHVFSFSKGFENCFTQITS